MKKSAKKPAVKRTRVVKGTGGVKLGLIIGGSVLVLSAVIACVVFLVLKGGKESAESEKKDAEKNVTISDPIEDKVKTTPVPETGSDEEKKKDSSVKPTQALTDDESNDEIKPGIAVSEEDSTENSEAKAIVDLMELNDKISQLFIVTPKALVDANGETVEYVSRTGKLMEAAYKRFPVGGIILDEQNVINEDIDSFKELVRDFRELAQSVIAGVPAFTAIVDNKIAGMLLVGEDAQIEDDILFSEYSINTVIKTENSKDTQLRDKNKNQAVQIYKKDPDTAEFPYYFSRNHRLKVCEIQGDMDVSEIANVLNTGCDMILCMDSTFKLNEVVDTLVGMAEEGKIEKNIIDEKLIKIISEKKSFEGEKNDRNKKTDEKGKGI